MLPEKQKAAIKELGQRGSKDGTTPEILEEARKLGIRESTYPNYGG